jgi:hypothetical protein
MYKFKCSVCNEIHEGLVAFSIDKPDSYWDVPPNRIYSDIELTSDTCIIANQYYFIRGSLEIPINDLNDKFEFGVWVSLSYESFKTYVSYLDKKKRNNVAPLFGWLNTNIDYYGNTLNYKTMVHLRNDFIRPFIELEDNDNYLNKDFKFGINSDKYQEIYKHYFHRESFT